MMAGFAERFSKGLRNAFAVEKGDEPLTPQEIDVADRVCREVARRRMTLPALMTLESMRPLNMVTATTLHFFQPLIAIVTDTAGYETFARLLERRGSIEHLCRRIEHFDEELNQAPRKR